MNLSGAMGIESAVLLLFLASLAAVQARAVRGAQRHRILDLCRRRGEPHVYEQIIAASETIAFVAASIVVLAAVVATLLAFRGLQEAAGGLLALEVSTVALWIAVVWCVLIPVPMLLTRFAGPMIVVATWRLWRPLVGLLSPAVKALGAGAAAMGRLATSKAATADGERPQDELRLVVDEAHREGRIEGAARDMLRGVIGLEEIRVSQIMTPRTRMIAIPVSTAWTDAVRLAAESGHTRLPVWDRSADDVVGILHTRDVLNRLAEGMGTRPVSATDDRDMRPLLRPPWFVPESMSVHTLLLEFQRGKTHMAIVTDEFGGVSGVVTIEDALEEIVGEIADEHDDAFSDGMRMVTADVYEVLAHVPVSRLNERMLVALPQEEGYETVGGLVFHQCGRIPEVGERIDCRGIRFEVLAATRRRIDLIRAERLVPPIPGSGVEDGG